MVEEQVHDLCSLCRASFLCTIMRIWNELEALDSNVIISHMPSPINHSISEDKDDNWMVKTKIFEEKCPKTRNKSQVRDSSLLIWGSINVSPEYNCRVRVTVTWSHHPQSPKTVWLNTSLSQLFILAKQTLYFREIFQKSMTKRK